MSWLSKARGLDKNKTLLDKINAVLRYAAAPEVAKLRTKFIKALVAKGIQQEQASDLFDTFLEVIDA